MTFRIRSLVITASGVLLACARPHTSSQDSASLGGDTTTLVMLDRGACHGTCPIYAVRLAANGQVRFVGARFVLQIGVDSARVPSTSVEALRTAFADRQFNTLPSAIEFGTSHCGRYVADLSTVELTVRVATGEHRVRYDQGCGDHPRMLDTLASMVDSVSGAARWTMVARP
jgi:Domain of unknown function (DUF6438)